MNLLALLGAVTRCWVRVMLYCGADPAPGPLSLGYLENVLAVAESLEFPEAYLAELRGLGSLR